MSASASASSGVHPRLGVDDASRELEQALAPRVKVCLSDLILLDMPGALGVAEVRELRRAILLDLDLRKVRARAGERRITHTC